MDKINKLTLPATILIASIIIGGFYYASELNKQKSIERQQLAELQAQKQTEQIKSEQEKKEYTVKRKQDCYELETSERKKWNNVNDSFYDEENDVCVVRYKTNEYKGKNCSEDYKGVLDMMIDCMDGVFRKTF